MATRNIAKTAAKGVAAGAALAALGYGALVAYKRLRYGRPKVSRDTANNSLIERYIPDPEIVEHHHIDINAPAALVLATAKEMEILDSPLIRVLIKVRELALGGEPDSRPHPAQLLEQMRSIGWVVLAEQPGREIVLGSVTRPWETAPVFRSIPAAGFLAFAEPGYVKIAWTLRADPAGDGRSVFHTETRACTTDAKTRARFRTYWSYVAPGVELIRLAMLKPLKRLAERKMAAAA